LVGGVDFGAELSFDSMLLLVVHPNRRGRSQTQGPLVTRELTLEMPSMVYKGTATLWDQGPRAVYKGAFFPLWFWLLCRQDFVLKILGLVRP
jgi:hypothetical protein